MDTYINPFVGQIAASRARSFLVHQFDMPRHLLRGFLRCPRDTVWHSLPVRECGAAGLPAPNASHHRVRPAIPKNKFLEVS